jgi:hypothetical protein
MACTFSAPRCCSSRRGDEVPGFKREWLVYANGQPTRTGLNVYLLCDPANSKRKKSDFTAMWGGGARRRRELHDPGLRA